MTQPGSLSPDAASVGPATESDLDRVVRLATSFPLPVFRQNYRHVRDKLHAQARSLWLQGGGTLPTARRLATVVTGGQQLVSHMAQIYARDSLGANFTPFNPGPGITERPNVDKVEEYLRPAREEDTGKALKRLGTLINTDLQLTKVRTFYSAFDEDINQNRRSIKLYRRVPSGEKPCALCEIASQQVYFTDDLLPIHDDCQCDIEEDDGTRLSDDDLQRHHVGFVERVLATGDQKKMVQSLADEDAPPEAYHNLVAVRGHGELGPVLTWKHQKFRGPADLPNPRQPRPNPVLGVGFGHTQRLQENAARVNQYRRAKSIGDEQVPVHAKRVPVPEIDLGHVDIDLTPQDLDKLLADMNETAKKKLIEQRDSARQLASSAEIKTRWSDADYAKEDNPKLSETQRSQALAASKALIQKALRVEPAITSAARAVVEQQGGHMSGLEHRMKEGPSLYRKIQAEMLEKDMPAEQAASNIKDAVRYTGVFQPEGFWGSSDKLRDALVSIGAHIVKDPVDVPLVGYRGRNMAFTLHGVAFEMQTNTELGIATKEECHKIYDVARKLDAGPERDKLETEMQEKWDTIPITKGTPIVQTERDAKSGDPNKVLYVADSTKYRGTTIPGGEAELGSPEMRHRVSRPP